MQTNFTKTPNILFDKLLKELNYSELKILLVIIRQTNGYIDKSTKERKLRDRITYSQFQMKTGLSRRIISQTIKLMTEKGLILVTNRDGIVLDTPCSRKGKLFLYYSFQLQTSANGDMSMCNLRHQHVQNMEHNKRKYYKRNVSKENTCQHIEEVIKEMKSKWRLK